MFIIQHCVNFQPLETAASPEIAWPRVQNFVKVAFLSRQEVVAGCVKDEYFSISKRINFLNGQSLLDLSGSAVPSQFSFDQASFCRS